MIEIMPEDVEAVLLHDGWHVIDRKSFTITNSCVFGKREGTLNRVPEWKQVASWTEAPVGTVSHSVTVPFDSILGVRSKP
jgi:hypothetical protein